MNCKKLIEVAMPIKEISAESVRDKSIRHGHISTLHLWWARRPLPVCRAVVFASLVPDPLDENCPQAFKEAVELLLGREGNKQHGDPYKPYEDIPWTSSVDAMEDNLRNRLLMFIGKFSPIYLENEKKGKTTNAKDLLSDCSLIKWDNKNNEEIINKARKLIWVAHNSESLSISEKPKSVSELIKSFDNHYQAIKQAEQDLYSIPDRHIETDEVKQKHAALQKAIDAFLDKMPKVFDPFAGGGAIPLEAARLGCHTFGNDINPVAHIIQKGSVEFPQKFGKPITYSKQAFIEKYGQESFNNLDNRWKGFSDGEVTHINIPNRLSFDVEYYAKKLLKLTEDKIGHYYPTDKKGNKPIAYYWVRVGKCSNPSCNADVPLLSQFYIINKTDKKLHLNPIVKSNVIEFEINEGTTKQEGWINRGNLICPCCGNTTDNRTLKQQFYNNQIKEKVLFVIWENGGSKDYRLPESKDIEINIDLEQISYIPTEKLPITYTKAMAFCLWNYNKWGDIFLNRQLLFLNSFMNSINDLDLSSNVEYSSVLKAYLAIWFDRIASRQTAFGLWNTKAETIEHPFGKQAIQMVFDFPESNPFCNSGGSAISQLDWITKYIENESSIFNFGYFNNSKSGEIHQFSNKYFDSVITDPPYYDAVAYADLSDFFYVWLKKLLIEEFPNIFAYPLAPKDDECTALKHHRNENELKAQQHFESKLEEIFTSIEYQTNGVISIMFAHQSTKAWTTLCNSILHSNMNISSSWAISTERTSGTKVDKAFLASSVTVSCIPTNKEGIGNFRNIKQSIEDNVKNEIKLLYELGFRGADLLTACFGQAVSVFGKYERVEKADGSEVIVAELLDLAREAAFNAIISDIDTDDVTKFYIGWLNLFGFTQAEHDDVRRITQIGLNIDINELYASHILLRNGNKQSLADFKERNLLSNKLGEYSESYTIDRVHKAMLLYSGTKRNVLLKFIAENAATPDSNFWRVTNSLAEILPNGSDDHKEVSGLITNKDSLIRESKNILTESSSQLGFDFN
jgi:adenine-specific DNA methylase